MRLGAASAWRIVPKRTEGSRGRWLSAPWARLNSIRRHVSQDDPRSKGGGLIFCTLAAAFDELARECYFSCIFFPGFSL